MLVVREIKKTASGIINKNLVTHIAAILFPAICGLAFFQSATLLSEIAASAAGALIGNITLIMFLFFTVAMTIPLLYGLAVFEANCAENKKAEFYDLFRAFSSTALYFRSVCFFYSMLWRFLAVFAVPIALSNEFMLYMYAREYSFFNPVIYGGYDLTYTFIILLITVLSILSVLIYSQFIYAAYFVVKNEEYSVSDGFFAAKLFMHNCKEQFYSLVTSFSPLIFLTVISFGILSVYTVPLMLISIFVFAHTRNTSEDLNRMLEDKFLRAKNKDL